MTTTCPVPSQIEPDAVADLIADAALIELPRQAAPDATTASRPTPRLVIPPASVSLVDCYGD
jgi:hypothetical protein